MGCCLGCCLGAVGGAVGGAGEIDGWVLAGMQGNGAGALLTIGCKGACSLGWCCFGMLFGLLFNANDGAVRAGAFSPD